MMATIASEIVLGDQESSGTKDFALVDEDPPSDLAQLAASFPREIRDRDVRLDRILQERRLRAGSNTK